jgi:sugar O-acyltransferase (sialic acid O-acetyltransferase NeuD family)
MYLFGASGHCKVVLDILLENKEFDIEGVLDNNPKLESIFNIAVFNTSKLNSSENKQLIITIGDNQIRKKIANSLAVSYLKAIHPKSIISSFAKINEGTVVMAGAIINPNAVIGKHCIINSGAVIEHDCTIDNFAHISPNATLAGGVIVGEGSHIGINASVIQNIKIGKWVIIGAGAVIINDIPDFAVVVGNPGKIIKFKNINE